MILLTQISTNLINQDEHGIHKDYYDKIWASRGPEGFIKPDDFWEIPNWIAIVKHNIENAELAIVRDIDKFLNNIPENTTSIAFSVLDANKAIIKEIIQRYKGNAYFVLGGYIDFTYFNNLKDTSPVYVFESIPDFVNWQQDEIAHKDGFKSISDFINWQDKKAYKDGYDYSLFSYCECIPRLTLSTGCSHKCKFCTEAGNLKEADMDSIYRQIESYKNLNFKLVYLNDKTFGQAKNHIELPDLYQRIKKVNANFEGFMIQTTTGQWLQFSDKYILDSHIIFVELGIETFNNYILKAYRKPSTEELTIKATERFRHLSNVWLRPNIIVGFAEETYESYQHTLDYLKEYKDVIVHLGICNLAIYDNTALGKERPAESLEDKNEYSVTKSFHEDEAPHKWFFKEIFKLGLKLLDKHPKNGKLK